MKGFARRGRAQVGIGTLIVFVAMVLVAAIASGVLLGTAGILQSKSEQTGDESVERVTDGVSVQSAVGEVTFLGSTYGKYVRRANLTVTLSPGSEDVDFEKTTIIYSDDWNVTHLEFGGTYYGNANDTRFAVSKIQDTDNSVPVLNEIGDTFVITFSLNEVHDVSYHNGLPAGEDATIKIVTPSGGVTTYRLTVPDSIRGDEFVTL